MRSLFRWLFPRLFSRLLPVAAGLLLACGVLAQAPQLIVNTTWTVDSVIVIDQNTAVSNLTIEPGVTVIFEGDFFLEIRGPFSAVGTAEKPITFTRKEGIEGWGGIRIHQPTGTPVLDHSIVEHSIHGGITIHQTDVVITDCVIRHNSVSSARPNFLGGFQGAGIFSDGSLTLPRCRIESNWALNDHGGGIRCFGLTLEDCVVSGNRVTRTNGVGGALYCTGPLTIRRSELSRNSISSSNTCGNSQATGGAVYVDGDAESVIANCEFTHNSIRASAGHGCTFPSDRGTAFEQGGALYVSNGTLSVSNVLFAHNDVIPGNLSSRQGSGLFVNSASGEITNCTVAFNTGGVSGISAPATVTAVNCIFYFNTGVEADRGLVAEYCAIEGGYPGTGNIDRNPVFRSPNDLSIAPGSPCIDSGNPDPAFNDGACVTSIGPDYMDPTSDMGVHGGPGACEGPFHQPDCNQNSIGDTADILDGRSTDCNGNGIPDECDILAATSADSDANGIPDECQRFSARLEPAGEVCWDLFLTNDVDLHGGELSLAYDGSVLAPPGVTAESGLTSHVDPGSLTVDTTQTVSRCPAGFGGLSLSWVTNPDPAAGETPIPPGDHLIARLCFPVRGNAPPGKCGAVMFTDCLGAGNTAGVNVVTGGDGESIPLFTRGAEFCPDIFRRGDINDDGRLDISDPVALLIDLFLTRDPFSCPDAADADDDGAVDISDAVHLIRWRFQDGPAPPAPGTICNRDPTEDPLENCTYLSCFN